MSNQFDVVVTYRMPCVFSKNKDFRHEITLGLYKDHLTYVHTECDSHVNPQDQSIFNGGERPHCGDYREWAINMAQGKASYSDPKLSSSRFNNSPMSSTYELLDQVCRNGNIRKKQQEQNEKATTAAVIHWPLTHIIQVHTNTTLAQVKQTKAGELYLAYTHQYGVAVREERINDSPAYNMVDTGNYDSKTSFCVTCRKTLSRASYKGQEAHCRSAAHLNNVKEAHNRVRKAFLEATIGKHRLLHRRVRNGLFSIGEPFYKRATAGKIEAYRNFYRDRLHYEVTNELSEYFTQARRNMPGAALERLVRRLNRKGYHKLDVIRMVKLNEDREDLRIP